MYVCMCVCIISGVSSFNGNYLNALSQACGTTKNWFWDAEKRKTGLTYIHAYIHTYSFKDR